MTSKQDQRYIQIARACLRALNQAASSASAREESIKAVYEAIDIAFNKQTAALQSELRSASDALAQIRDNAQDLNEAQRIATETLNKLTAVLPAKSLH